MRWILRHTVFTLCFIIGTTTWFVLAQKRLTLAPTVQHAEEIAVNQAIAPVASESPQIVPGQSIKFVPVEPINGVVNTQTLILRESAEANAPIVAKLKGNDYEQVLILGATRDFLHVRLAANEGAAVGAGMTVRTQDYEGWTTWSSVMLDMSAIVLDAETGEVVSRVPLTEGLSSVIFSPDGSRAIFTSQSSGLRQTAYEVRTSDYTLTRSLISPDEQFGAFFYASDGRDVYAKVYAAGESLVRISDGDAPNAPTSIAPNIIISRDGQVGLIARREEGDDELTVDMLEMATLEVRNTFELRGDNLSEDGSGFFLSRDGAELYLRPSEENRIIRVFDTRTGRLVRELQHTSAQGSSYFGEDSVVGDSILISVWKESDDEMDSPPQRFWVSEGKRMLAETGIDHPIEAGGRRYAVNDEGTLLFQLNENNRIQKRLTISRTERGGQTDEGAPTVFGLSASPDGKRIIMFVGISDSCAH
jgi:hypothetical protein